MCLLLLALASSALGASSVSFLDVSDRFNLSLERMAKELRDGRQETVAVGTFPLGEFSISDAQIGNMSTIRRTSGASLLWFRGRRSVEGGLSLGDMVIQSEGFGGNALAPKIKVRENFWSYNFLIDENAENCITSVTVLSTDLGEIKLITQPNSKEQDITYWVKHHMTDDLRLKITNSIAGVFMKHFDFCNLIKI